MKKPSTYTFWFLISLPVLALAEPPKGTIEAEWAIEEHLANPDARQNWVVDQDWQTDFNVELGLTQNGFGLSTALTTDQVSLTELYYESAIAWMDYSLGLRKQEWAYAWYESQLNWLDDQQYALAEHYFSVGSGQLFCRTSDGLCGTRFSGWYNRFDWQYLLGHSNRWHSAAALQYQFGSGGLSYIESAVEENAKVTELRSLAPSVMQLKTTKQTAWQNHIGLQWTTGFNLTLLGEWVYRPQALDRNDWQNISQQLTTHQAGLLADSFEQPLSQQTFLLREQWQADALSLENVTLYWPQAKHSFINECTIKYEANAVLTLSAQWQHAGHSSVLADIGQGDTVRLGITFNDGW
ncbi:MAG: hypothetical protein P8X74_17200 [Reinekea sp.]|jgi:hypothetical protein